MRRKAHPQILPEKAFLGERCWVIQAPGPILVEEDLRQRLAWLVQAGTDLCTVEPGLASARGRTSWVSVNRSWWLAPHIQHMTSILLLSPP